MAQRFYEPGVGSRTGMRPTSIPANPAAMRDQMESMFRTRHQAPRRSSDQHSAQQDANVAMYYSKYNRSIRMEQINQVSRSAARRSVNRPRQSADWIDGEDAGALQAYDDSDETDSNGEEEEEDGEEEAPSFADRMRAGTVANRPASLFTSTGKESIKPNSKPRSKPKGRKPQPGNYSWMAEMREGEDDDNGNEQVALAFQANPPPRRTSSSSSRPRPRAAKPNLEPSSNRPRTSNKSPRVYKRKVRDLETQGSKRPKSNSDQTKEAPTGSQSRGRQSKEPPPSPDRLPPIDDGLEITEEQSVTLKPDSYDEEKRELASPNPKRRPGRPRKKQPFKNSFKSANTVHAGDAQAHVRTSANEVEELIPAHDHEEETDGLRRSTRHRIKPLEWWRGERAEYGRPSLGNGQGDPVNDVPGPTLRKVYRVTRSEGEGTFSGLRFRKSKRPRTAPARYRVRAAARAASRTDDDGSPRPDNPEEDDEGYVELDPTADNVAVEDGMDEKTERMQLVWDPDVGHEVERVIACTSLQMNPHTPAGRNYAFEKLLSADETLAAGILSVPVGGSKPTKPSKDNNYVFVVIQGAALLKVGKSEFMLSPGGMFLVPRGNNYSIKNAAQRELRLFFTQTRSVNRASMALRASVQPRPGPETATPASGTAFIQQALGSWGSSSFSRPDTPTTNSWRR